MPGKLIQINHFYLEVVNKINQYKGGNLRDADCRHFFMIIYYLLSESIVEEQEDAQDADETQDADWRKLAELHEGSFIGGDDTLYEQHCQSLLPGYRTPITT